MCCISIHALREEGDLKLSHKILFGQYFYPRPPRGGRLINKAWNVRDQTISIHALREEGDRIRPRSFQFLAISIHALREEGDAEPDAALTRAKKISIHALREEGDFLSDPYRRIDHVFLSTPSARRATARKIAAVNAYHISIHALREEGDKGGDNLTTRQEDFYPRPPRGGRRSAAGAPSFC